jgi:hypothetical protein
MALLQHKGYFNAIYFGGSCLILPAIKSAAVDSCPTLSRGLARRGNGGRLHFYTELE